jgi:(2Fe-2S) ferredoxin
VPVARRQKALQHLENKLGIEMGETTADGLFTVQQSECLGACADAPVMLVNDRTMCSFMSNDKLDQLVDGLRAAEGQVMTTARRQSSLAVPGHRACKPAFMAATSIRRSMRTEWQQLAPEGLRGARRLPGAAQDPGQGWRPG